MRVDVRFDLVIPVSRRAGRSTARIGEWPILAIGFLVLAPVGGRQVVAKQDVIGSRPAATVHPAARLVTDVPERRRLLRSARHRPPRPRSTGPWATVHGLEPALGALTLACPERLAATSHDRQLLRPGQPFPAPERFNVQ